MAAIISGRRLRQELQGLQRLPFQKDETRFDFGCALSGPRLHNRSNPGDEKGPPFQELDNLESLHALGHEMVRSIGSCDVPRDIGDRADAAHIGSQRLVDFGALLHENADLPLLAHRLLRGPHGKRLLNRDGEHGSREQDCVAHRYDDQCVLRHGGRDLGRCRRGLVERPFKLTLSHRAPPIFPIL